MEKWESGGLVVDQNWLSSRPNLSWNSHITKVHKTVSMLLARFRRIKPFLPTDAGIKFCNAFILPHFDYCEQSGVPPIWTDFLSYKKEQHK